MWDENDEFDDFETEDSEFESDNYYSTCPNCRASIYEDAPQCPNCGEYIVESDLSYSPRWYYNRWLVAFVSLLLLLTIFLFWVFQ